MSFTIHEEFRLVERTENDINKAWKGAHLLLFFLAFVFGSFCTFCFHMLMYLFDEKCVLFPKLLSLTSQRHNVIYEFIPTNSDLSNLPVDFVSTQWVDKSTCELPTYVPLVSGIFGLVWTTMFLMCSTGSRTLTGLQRPWRVLPPVFVFSVLMGTLCVYSSIITHSGLQELCIKLGEITGSSTCTYTVNVATLTYERRIRGVYQATRLTIATAWLHTACWLCSAVLTIVRVILVVDFQLVRINISLRGDIDKIMEQHETQIRSVMPDDSPSSERNPRGEARPEDAQSGPDQMTELLRKTSGSYSESTYQSKISLLPQEKIKNERRRAYAMVPIDARFIVELVYNLVDNINFEKNMDRSSNKQITKELYEKLDDGIKLYTLSETERDFRVQNNSSEIIFSSEKNKSGSGITVNTKDGTSNSSSLELSTETFSSLENMTLDLPTPKQETASTVTTTMMVINDAESQLSDRRRVDVDTQTGKKEKID